jgi:Flp pilus assembly protein TadD
MARARTVGASLWVVAGLVGAAVAARGQAAAGSPGNSGAAAATAPMTKSCPVNSFPPTTGEATLNKRDAAGAEKIFREVLAKSPESDNIHEALVRALIEEGKVDDAAKETDPWVAAMPNNSMALVAEGDLKLRQGDPRGALGLFTKARSAELCNARALYGMARVYSLAGFHATAQREIEQAYLLHPTDDDIHGWWISTRQRKERLALLADYAEHSDQQTDEQRKRLKEQLARESVSHTGDCRIAEDSPKETTVPMAMLLDGPTKFDGWGLDVQLNGKRRRLQIDTGASGITISRSAAMFLGIVRDDTAKMSGIGDDGSVRTSIAHVPSIRIGSVEFKNCPVEILEKWSALNTDGLIGTDVFTSSQVTLDFPKHELRLASLPERPGDKKPDAKGGGDDEAVVAHDPYVAPEMSKWLRIYRSGHELLMPTGIVETKQLKDEKAWKDKIFLLDTGAYDNLISPKAAREVAKVSRDYDDDIRGVSGEVKKVFEAGTFTLAFAGLRLDASRMTAIDLTDLSKDSGMEVSGLIGAPALFQLVMHIDYRDNLVMFEYTPQK